MEKWTLLSHVLGLAIGAGLNLYAVVLVAGLGIRLQWLPDMPGDLQVLAHPVVLTIAGALYLAEFAADKVPFFTPVWDGVHTFVRPIGGALLALGATAEMGPVVTTLATILGGTLTLGTHSSKMGFRLLAHSMPDPATHSGISLTEDFSVVVLLALAYRYPWVALPVLLIVVAAILMFLPILFRIARFVSTAVRSRLQSWYSRQTEEVTDTGHVRAFARQVKGAPRLAKGWLQLETGDFQFTRWGSRRTLQAGELDPRIQSGILYNVARTRNGWSFYLMKDSSGRFTSSASHTPA